MHSQTRLHLVVLYYPIYLLLNLIYILINVSGMLNIFDILPIFCGRFLHLCLWGMLPHSFFIMSFSSFGNRVIIASQNELQSVPSSCVLWKSLGKFVIFFLSLMFGRNNQWNYLGLEFSILGKFMSKIQFLYR